MKTTDQEQENQSLAVRAQAEGMKALRGQWALLRNLCEQAGARELHAANVAREVGLTLQGLCAHEQMDFSFFDRLKAEWPEGFTFDAARKCMNVATAHPEAFETLPEAKRIMQTVFQITGQLPFGESREPQSPVNLTPASIIMKTFDNTKMRLEKELEEAADWDDWMRASVREEIRKFETWAHKAAEKL